MLRAMSTAKSHHSSIRYLPEILVVAAVLVYGFFFGFAWNAQQEAVVRWWGGTSPAATMPLFRVIVASFLAGVAVMAVLGKEECVRRLGAVLGV